MTQDKKEQIELLAQTRDVINKLRTNLFMIEDFKNYDYWNKKLKRLKSDLNEIYWNI